MNGSRSFSWKSIERRIDAGAIAVVDAAADRRQKGSEVIAILTAADLDSVHFGQQFELVAERPQILPAGLHLLDEAPQIGQSAGDGLEVNIVFEENAGDTSKLSRVLAHHQVFKLQNVDAASIDLAMDEPCEIGVAKLEHRVWCDRADVFLAGLEADHVLDRGANAIQFFVRIVLMRIVQHDDHVKLAQSRELANGLIHEHAASVHRRADRVRRDEQHAQRSAVPRDGIHLRERVAEMAAQGTAEGFRVGNRGKCSRPRTGNEHPRKLERGAGDAVDARALRRIAEEPAQHRAGPGHAEMRGKPSPLMNVLPGEEQEVFLEHRLNIGVREPPSDGATMFVIDDAGRLVHHLPSAFPREITQVGIFHVERRQQRIESAELEKFAAVEGGRAAAAVGARVKIADGRVGVMADSKTALLPPHFGEACLFPQFGGIGEKDLAGDGENFFIGESVQKWLKEIPIDTHIAVEQNHDVVPRGLKS